MDTGVLVYQGIGIAYEDCLDIPKFAIFILIGILQVTIFTTVYL